MLLAAIIDETSAVPTLEAIQETPGFELDRVWVERIELRTLVQEKLPWVHFVDHWDDILIAREVDAVVVAGTSEEVLSASRQLVQIDTPLLVVTKTSTSPAKLFEYMPLWQERPDLITPVFLSGVQAVSQAALQAFSESNCGHLWRLELTRSLKSHQAGEQGLTPISIDQTLLQDLKWICETIGIPHHVTMMTSGPTERPTEVTVTLGGKDVAESRWTLTSQSEKSSWELKLTGTSGQLLIRCEDDQRPVMEADGASRPLPIEQTLIADAAIQLQAFEQKQKSGTEASDWIDVIRLAEIGAAARRSQLRRRTIDVHFEETSERSQFKSQMTAIGCGALLWTMFGMMCLLGFAGLFDPRDREFRTSSAADFVLEQHDFLPHQAGLSSSGTEKLKRIESRWSSTSPVLIIENVATESPAINQQRVDRILDRLTAAGIRTPEQRTVQRNLSGKWFEAVLILGWIVVFAPLGMVLVMQFLIVAARHSQSKPPAPKVHLHA